MSPHTALRAAALAAAIFTSTSASAGAAESAMPTRQASAYGMDWIPYIDPADLPPVSQRKAVCLVDTGVDVTPDLPSDRPEGPVVARLSVDGGSGLPGNGDRAPARHGHGVLRGRGRGERLGHRGCLAGGPDRVGTGDAVRRDDVPAGELSAGADVLPQVRGRTTTSSWRTCRLSSSRQIERRASAHRSWSRFRVRMTLEMSVVAAAGNGGGALEIPGNVDGVLPVAAG